MDNLNENQNLIDKKSNDSGYRSILNKTLTDCIDLLSELHIENNNLEDQYLKADLNIMRQGLTIELEEHIYSTIDKFWNRRTKKDTIDQYQCYICLIDIKPNHGRQQELYHYDIVDYFSPCACSGINKYIHKSCYREIIIRGTKECGICKMPYPTRSMSGYYSEYLDSLSNSGTIH